MGFVVVDFISDAALESVFLFRPETGLSFRFYFDFFEQTSLLLNKAAFKNTVICELLLQFKIAVLYVNIL